MVQADGSEDTALTSMVRLAFPVEKDCRDYSGKELLVAKSAELLGKGREGSPKGLPMVDNFPNLYHLARLRKQNENLFYNLSLFELVGSAKWRREEQTCQCRLREKFRFGKVRGER